MLDGPPRARARPPRARRPTSATVAPAPVLVAAERDRVVDHVQHDARVERAGPAGRRRRGEAEQRERHEVDGRRREAVDGAEERAGERSPPATARASCESERKMKPRKRNSSQIGATTHVSAQAASTPSVPALPPISLTNSFSWPLEWSDARTTASESDEEEHERGDARARPRATASAAREAELRGRHGPDAGREEGPRRRRSRGPGSRVARSVAAGREVAVRDAAGHDERRRRPPTSAADEAA